MERYALDPTRTIFALASGTPPTAVALVKLSGPDAFSFAARVAPAAAARLGARERFFRPVPLEKGGSTFDEALLLAFPAPHSHTGEDVIEFHCHGSVAVVRTLEQELLSFGAALARPGEFSYRAFLHGKTTAEGLDSLADTYAARRPEALRLLAARETKNWAEEWDTLRDQLLRLQAILDTAVDFSDEYLSVVTQGRQPLALATQRVEMLIQRFERLTNDRFLPRVVLAGAPNAGKSSLFNALLGRYRALVSAEPGTTRDLVEEDVFLSGQTIRLVDSAGLRGEGGTVEREGMRLAEEAIAESALWVLVVDGTSDDYSALDSLLEKYGAQPHRIFWNKADAADYRKAPERWTVLEGSAANGAGVDAVAAAIADLVGKEAVEGIPPAAQQVRGLVRLRDQLHAMALSFDLEVAPEAIAEECRACLRELVEVSGPVDPEEVLDRVFSSFCIGK